MKIGPSLFGCEIQILYKLRIVHWREGNKLLSGESGGARIEQLEKVKVIIRNNMSGYRYWVLVSVWSWMRMRRMAERSE